MSCRVWTNRSSKVLISFDKRPMAHILPLIWALIWVSQPKGASTDLAHGITLEERCGVPTVPALVKFIGRLSDGFEGKSIRRPAGCAPGAAAAPPAPPRYPHQTRA